MSLFWFCLIAALALLAFLFHVRQFNSGLWFLKYLSAFLGLWIILTLNFHASAIHPVIIYLGVFLLSLLTGYVLLNYGKMASEWFSRLKFFQKSSKLPPYLVEVLKACAYMAGRKVGALVIIERKESVSPHLTGGIGFQAEIKSEVLISLFMPPSMVHDGAVIVKNGQIQKVKAVLPLATQHAVPMGVGTRHRSAIGLTERTDAIAIVVSEERGETSIVYRGQLVKSASQEQTEKLLRLALRQQPLVK